MARHQRPQRIQHRHIKCMLHINRFAMLAAFGEMCHHFHGLFLDVLYHHIAAHAHLAEYFHRESSLHIPRLAITKHHTQTLAKRTNAIEEAIRSTIERIICIEFFDRFAARHNNQAFAANAQSHYRPICLIQMIPYQMIKFVYWMQLLHQRQYTNYR